jgi:hypothetical protein
LNFGLIQIGSAAAGWFGEGRPKSALSSPDDQLTTRPPEP